MLIKTHLLITLFFVLILLNFFEFLIENGFLFVSVCLLSTILPDIDSKFSKIGKFKIFRPLQFFVNHRGFFHSLIFLGFVSIILWHFIPSVIIPFILGYSLHLVSDSFTIKGIYPFYPSNKVRWKGFVKTGGRIEILIFIFLFLINIFFIILFFS